MSLSGKVIIVTGGSKGIGRAISQRLAQDGASVVVNFSRDVSAADEVVQAIGQERALAVQADVGSVAGVEKLVAATVERFGRVDVVIPNAGIMPMRTTGNTTEEDFDRAFALNVKGPYFLAQVCLPRLCWINIPYADVSVESSHAHGARWARDLRQHRHRKGQHCGGPLPVVRCDQRRR